jgi:hypothetical protein
MGIDMCLATLKALNDPNHYNVSITTRNYNGKTVLGLAKDNLRHAEGINVHGREKYYIRICNEIIHHLSSLDGFMELFEAEQTIDLSKWKQDMEAQSQLYEHEQPIDLSKAKQDMEAQSLLYQDIEAKQSVFKH